MSSERDRRAAGTWARFAGAAAAAAIAAAAAAAAVLPAGCADLERGPRAADAADAGDAGTPTAGDGAAALSFAADVHALLVDGCGGCHQTGGMAGETDLLFSGDAAADRQVVVSFVSLDQPAASRLLSKGAGLGHGGGAVYRPGDAEYEVVLRWITQGAPP
jgi:hypothetical protein